MSDAVDIPNAIAALGVLDVPDASDVLNVSDGANGANAGYSVLDAMELVGCKALATVPTSEATGSPAGSAHRRVSP